MQLIICDPNSGTDFNKNCSDVEIQLSGIFYIDLLKDTH
jgi:hypothetical protein